MSWTEQDELQYRNRLTELHQYDYREKQKQRQSKIFITLIVSMYVFLIVGLAVLHSGDKLNIN